MDLKEKKVLDCGRGAMFLCGGRWGDGRLTRRPEKLVEGARSA